MEKVRTIYIHIFPDNSVYIGVTSQKNLNLRWGYNGNGYDTQEDVKNAISFWGWCNIKHEILEQGIMTKEESLQKECDYTLEYVNKGYKVLNKFNVNNPCRYRNKNIKHNYEYYDITTGKSYNSLRDAGKDIDVSHEAIRISIKENRSVKGHKFIKRIKEINIVLEGI